MAKLNFEEAELESFLSAADVWVIPYRKNDTGESVPSRIYNLLAIGRPIIICLEPDAEAAILVREHDLGWMLQPEDPAARRSGSQPWCRQDVRERPTRRRRSPHAIPGGSL
jgi:hypothetical protein